MRVQNKQVDCDGTIARNSMKYNIYTCTRRVIDSSVGVAAAAASLYVPRYPLETTAAAVYECTHYYTGIVYVNAKHIRASRIAHEHTHIHIYLCYYSVSVCTRWIHFMGIVCRSVGACVCMRMPYIIFIHEPAHRAACVCGRIHSFISFIEYTYLEHCL